jgi:hypothetical protein
MKYKELEQAFKAIHDEYVASDSFKQWAAAKEAWEDTETYKTEPERYRYLPTLVRPYRSRDLFSEISANETIQLEYTYSPNEEDYNVYSDYARLTKRTDSGSLYLQCPKRSQSQEKFDLKRKLLLIEHGLSPDTKLPSEWYWGGYEWDWS